MESLENYLLKKHERLFAFFQKSVDALVVALAWGVAFTIRFHIMEGGQTGLELLFLKLTPVLIILTFYFYYQNGLYRSMRFNNRYIEIFAVFKANFMATLSFVIFLYFFAETRLSRIVLIYYFLISSFLLILTRMMVRNFLRALRRRGKNLRYILLVGNGAQFEQYIETMRDFKDAGIEILGWAESDGLAEKLKVPSITGTLKELINEFSPQTVVLGYNHKSINRLEEVLKDNYDELTPIQILPDLSYSFIGHRIEDFAGVPLLNVNHPHITGLQSFAKRLFDFLCTFFGLIILSPLLLFLGFLVKMTSRGPIFYGQDRMGLDGGSFKMWKFRTMKMAESDEDQTTWTTKDDPRKTTFGNFLRKTSLDELPQIFNVMVGDMSLVGPRPERPFFVDKFKDEIPAYMLRHKMKAGITGWAQINGWRGDTSIKRRIEFDIYYIKHWSLWFDIKILFLTFWKGLINKNAY
jgi:Undecaprenyl-phosphate glucose phosphotransferase